MKRLYVTLHGVGEPPPQIDSVERKFWWDESEFLSTLELVAEGTESPVSIELTFDDGNDSDVRIVLPALVRRNLTARFFVCTGRLGKRGYLDASAVRDLLAAGMTVGSHGIDHVRWHGLQPEQLEAEIRESRAKLEQVCDTHIDEISVPFGAYGRRVLARIGSAGYAKCFTSDGGLMRREKWLVARNTLDRSWQGTPLEREHALRNPLLRRIRRAAAMQYRALR